MTENTEKRGDAAPSTTEVESVAGPVTAPGTGTSDTATTADATTADASTGVAGTSDTGTSDTAADTGTAVPPAVAPPPAAQSLPPAGAATPPAVPGTRPMAPSDEVSWSVFAHLSWIAGSFVGLPPLGPLVVYLVLRERGAFVRHQSAQAFNFQLSLFIYAAAVAIIGTVATVVTFGLAAPALAAAVVAVAVLGIVLSIVAAVAAGRGQWYRYPLTISFVS